MIPESASKEIERESETEDVDRETEAEGRSLFGASNSDTVCVVCVVCTFLCDGVGVFGLARGNPQPQLFPSKSFSIM